MHCIYLAKSPSTQLHTPQDATDGFLVDVWTKSNFIKYYNDNSTGRPVRWTFLESGAEFHIMK